VHRATSGEASVIVSGGGIVLVSSGITLGVYTILNLPVNPGGVDIVFGASGRRFVGVGAGDSVIKGGGVFVASRVFFDERAVSNTSLGVNFSVAVVIGANKLVMSVERTISGAGEGGSVGLGGVGDSDAGLVAVTIKHSLVRTGIVIFTDIINHVVVRKIETLSSGAVDVDVNYGGAAVVSLRSVMTKLVRGTSRGRWIITVVVVTGMSSESVAGRNGASGRVVGAFKGISRSNGILTMETIAGTSGRTTSESIAVGDRNRSGEGSSPFFRVDNADAFLSATIKFARIERRSEKTTINVADAIVET